MPQDNGAKRLLDRALAQWRQWPIACEQPPEVLCRLGCDTNNHTISHTSNQTSNQTSNHTNHSYLLAMGDARYVLRIATVQDLHAVDIHAEQQLQNALAQSGIAPDIVWQSELAREDAGHYYRISHYLNGTTLADAPLNDAQDFSKRATRGGERELRELVALLQRVQSPEFARHSAALAPISYAGQMEHYWRIAQQRPTNPVLAALAAQHDVELERARAFEADYPQRVLCHHDLNPGNILRLADPRNGHGFALLDWEFAAPGIGSIDYAALAVEHAVAPSRIAALCDYSLDELQRAIDVYRYLCEIYNAALLRTL